MSELERESSVGRFLLEKRSKFNIQGGSKIVSCDIAGTGKTTTSSSKVIMVIG